MTAKPVAAFLDPFLRDTLASLLVWPNRRAAAGVAAQRVQAAARHTGASSRDDASKHTLCSCARSCVTDQCCCVCDVSPPPTHRFVFPLLPRSVTGNLDTLALHSVGVLEVRA